MKILILAGGTGSIALQTGLYNLTSRFENLDIKILVNAYDNGLSTGAVRKVLGGHILGPSDVRKNQTTRFKLEKPDHPLNAFMNIRFTTTAKEAKAFCLYEIEKYAIANANFPEDGCIDIFRKAVETYFGFPMASNIDYDDFSLSNIIYAGLAAQNSNSLRAAATIMAKVMGIKDNVILNDDTSLFLGAVTKRGKKIVDEGEIVCWNNPEDPIVELTFTDAYGEERHPKLCDEALNAILDADIIILSSGTQWSSLIPTYESLGFRYAMSNAQAKILMVMNKVPDKDAPNQSASDIIRTLVPTYFPKNRLNVILDTNGQEGMTQLDEDAYALIQSMNRFILSDEFGSKTTHDSFRLGVAVLQTIYSEYLDKSTYVFDYDDTLIGRGNSEPNASKFNDGALNTLLQGGRPTTSLIQSRAKNAKVAVCTGNSIRAIKLRRSKFAIYSQSFTPLRVFADGGINEYEYTYPTDVTEDDEPRPIKFINSVWPDALFSEKGTYSADNIINSLCAAGIAPAKIENRGNAVISIKPVDPEYRDLICDYINRIILANTGVVATATGRTTIDISLPGVSKKAAVELLLSELGPEETLVFVGDELASGNDKVIADYAANESRIKCLTVFSPTDTALFFIALLGGNFG